MGANSVWIVNVGPTCWSYHVDQIDYEMLLKKNVSKPTITIN